MKKIKKVLVAIVGSVLAWSNLPYYYNNEKAAAYASCLLASYMVWST